MGSGDDGAHSQNEKIELRNYIEGVCNNSLQITIINILYIFKLNIFNAISHMFYTKFALRNSFMFIIINVDFLTCHTYTQYVYLDVPILKIIFH